MLIIVWSSLKFSSHCVMQMFSPSWISISCDDSEHSFKLFHPYPSPLQPSFPHRTLPFFPFGWPKDNIALIWSCVGLHLCLSSTILVTGKDMQLPIQQPLWLLFFLFFFHQTFALGNAKMIFGLSFSYCMEHRIYLVLQYLWQSQIKHKHRQKQMTVKMEVINKNTKWLVAVIRKKQKTKGLFWSLNLIQRATAAFNLEPWFDNHVARMVIVGCPSAVMLSGHGRRLVIPLTFLLCVIIIMSLMWGNYRKCSLKSSRHYRTQ